MNMTPRNLAIIIVAGILGFFIAFKFPLLGLIAFLGAMIYVVIVFMRNKGGELADPAELAHARTFASPENMGTIYVMRKAFVAGQQGMNITIDDTLETQFRTGHFARAEVMPGEHTVTAQMSSQTKGTAAMHVVEVGAGEAVLLDMKIDMGMVQGKPTFSETRNPAEARAKLATLKLVKWKTGA